MRGRKWSKRVSRSGRIDFGVWYDPINDRYEYVPDPRGGRATWHEVDWRQRLYRDIDPETGQPVSGSEGLWRSLR